MILRFLLCTILLFAALLPAPARAQTGGMTVIRDTEIESVLRQWCTPIWNAADLNPDAVKLILVQSTDFNAFVAGGSNIFIFTGMIQTTKNPGELLGVIAHETGHIAGGHLIRGREAAEHASYQAMLATILGMGIGMAGGGDAGSAIVAGGQGMAMASYLSHSRTEESSADQAGLRFMEGAGYSPKGMVTLLEKLKQQEYLPASQQNAYVRTHPLTEDRIAAMEAGAAKSASTNKPYPAAWDEQFKMIQAKLTGFIEPERVAWIYSEKDTSTPALYARAIAAYRRSEKDKALSLINQLIQRDGSNPYFHEMKGQMLRDFGQLPEAANSYRKAISLKPDAALVRIDLAQVLVEMAGGGNEALYTEAEKQLDLARPKEPRSSDIYRLYATIYGRRGQEAAAQYYLAEEASLKGDTKEAQHLLEGAMRGLKPGSKTYRQAQDLKVYLDTKPKGKNDDKNDTGSDDNG